MRGLRMNEISITKRKLNILPKNGTKFTFTIVAELDGEKESRLYDMLRECDTKGILRLLAE